MFKVHLGDTPHNLTQRDFDALGKKTDGFSGSDVSVVVKDVLMEPVRKTQDAMHFRYILCRSLMYGSALSEPYIRCHAVLTDAEKVSLLTVSLYKHDCQLCAICFLDHRLFSSDGNNNEIGSLLCLGRLSFM